MRRGDRPTAEAVREHFKKRLSWFGSVGQANVGRYWKRPAHLEVSVCGMLGQHASECFERVLETFGTGW